MNDEQARPKAWCPNVSYPCEVQFAASLEALFAKCVEVKLLKDGSVTYHCKRGLWSVSGPVKVDVEREAKRYWLQYFQDGEYDAMLRKGSRGKLSATEWHEVADLFAKCLAATEEDASYSVVARDKAVAWLKRLTSNATDNALRLCKSQCKGAGHAAR